MSAEHYFAAQPRVAADRRTVRFSVGDRDYRLTSSAGVFSADRLDPGTSVLLRKAPLPDAGTTGTLLDLGCGYGPIAAVLASTAPRATVYAVDVNTRALDLVRRNADETGLRIVAATPDEVPAGLTFTQIWSNPPIRVGKDELHALLRRWLARLAGDGVAWLVVARNLGADSLQDWLGGQGFAAQRYASQKGYRVLRVTPRNSGDTAPSGADNC